MLPFIILIIIITFFSFLFLFSIFIIIIFFSFSFLFAIFILIILFPKSAVAGELLSHRVFPEEWLITDLIFFPFSPGTAAVAFSIKVLLLWNRILMIFSAKGYINEDLRGISTPATMMYCTRTGRSVLCLLFGAWSFMAPKGNARGLKQKNSVRTCSRKWRRRSSF